MAENKLADLSTEFAVQILKLTDSYCLGRNRENASSRLRRHSPYAHLIDQHVKREQIGRNLLFGDKYRHIIPGPPRLFRYDSSNRLFTFSPDFDIV